MALEEKRLIPDDQPKVMAYPTYLAIVVACLAVGLCVPEIVSRSYTHDGIIYTSVAQLLATGQIDFWTLQYFDQSVEVFRDQPPLGISLVAGWSLLFGPTTIAGKALMLVCGLLVFVLAGLCERALGKETHSGTWTMFILIMMPLAVDAWFGGYLETLLTVSMFSAVYCCIKTRQSAWWVLPYAALTFTAVLIKGPVGLVPLAAPLALWYYDKSVVRPFLIGFTALALCCATLISTYLALPEAQAFWTGYVEDQVIASIRGDRTIEHTRLDLLGWLIKNVAIATLACITVRWLVNRFNTPCASSTTTTSPLISQNAGFWLILAMCASFPLMISSRFYEHYLLPCLPLYALVLANVFPPPLLPQAFAKCLPGCTVAAICLCLGLVMGNWQTPGRHQEEIHAAQLIAERIADTSTVVAYCERSETIKVRGYLYLYHGYFSKSWIDSSESDPLNWAICVEPPVEHATRVLGLHEKLQLWRISPK